MSANLTLEVLPDDFSVCRVRDYSMTDLQDSFCFVGKTDEENSLVCRTAKVPANCTAREDGWRAFRIVGVLDFSLIGILSAVSAVLAAHRIGIFVVSTYNTDYVLTKRENFERALHALREAGYSVLSEN